MDIVHTPRPNEGHALSVRCIRLQVRSSGYAQYVLLLISVRHEDDRTRDRAGPSKEDSGSVSTGAGLLVRDDSEYIVSSYSSSCASRLATAVRCAMTRLTCKIGYNMSGKYDKRPAHERTGATLCYAADGYLVVRSQVWQIEWPH